jgi:hypothetical protein
MATTAVVTTTQRLPLLMHLPMVVLLPLDESSSTILRNVLYFPLN